VKARGRAGRTILNCRGSLSPAGGSSYTESRWLARESPPGEERVAPLPLWLLSLLCEIRRWSIESSQSRFDLFVKCISPPSTNYFNFQSSFHVFCLVPPLLSSKGLFLA
jgi:hypothetical protein